MPGSLAERIVYDIIEQESNSVNKSLHYQREESEFQRITIEPLPLGVGVKNSQKKFKEYMQKRLAFGNTLSFEDYLADGISRLPYGHFISVFTLAETHWEDDEGEIAEYLQWIIDAFRHTHPNAPTFVFFFVIGLKGFPDKHKPHQQKIFDDIQAFCEKNHPTLLYGLKPVSESHLEGWFGDIGIDDPNGYENIINMHYQGLPERDRLKNEESKYLFMKDAQELQKKVILTLRKLIKNDSKR